VRILSKDDILAAQDLRREMVEVPEWGGSVWVQAMTALDRDRWEMASIDIREVGGKVTATPKLDNLRASLCARTMVDESGARLFAEADVLALGGKSAAALDRVYEAARRLNGISQEDVDELAGNSDSAPAGTSPSH
jgi:hypothetical protein